MKKDKISIKYFCSCLLFTVFLSLVPAYADISRIHFNNQDLFLNGANLAWQHFADDIGPSTYSPDLAHFEDVFSQFEANGGNCMRLWLHTNGAHTPEWSGFTVVGPGTDTISDLQDILDLAWEHKVSMMLCLWSFDMLRTSYGDTINDRAEAILTNTTYRQSYIDNCLIPMVTALAGHPAIVAWEIFNEPEGMSDEFGWSFTRHVPMADIQAFVNTCAGAIHRTDPTVMVTNGCWDMQAGTDVDGHYNYYTDARLINAGGDADGTLDFYCIHYYDWAGTAHSPFLHDASYWGLDKPLVIAEFYPDCDSTYCTSTPYESLYQNGYAGALGWSWTDVSPSLLLTQMYDIWTAHPEDVEIIISTDPNAPAAPTGLSATPGESMVSLNWNDNNEVDLDGYNVYRSTTSGGDAGGYDKLNSSLLTDSNYTDNDIIGGVTYYYVVTAVDTSLNESNDSNEVSATPTDTTPPSVPTGLTATPGSEVVSLDWDDNSESDLDGYNVYRSTTSGGGAGGYDKLNSSLLTSSDYTDSDVISGTTYYYVVTAIDKTSNESGYSSEVSAIPDPPSTDVEIIGDWTSGTSHTKETGTNRALLFIAHVEEAGSISLSSVTYGGQLMTKIIDEIVGSSYQAYVAAFILDEASVAAATSSTFVPDWSTTPDVVAYSSVFLENVDQTDLIGDSNSSSITNTTTLTTSVLSTEDGDMVIDAATCGDTGTYTVNNDFTEAVEHTMSSSDGVAGYKSATGATETPSVTHTTSANRQVLIGFVVRAAGVAGEWLYGDLTYDNRVDMNDLPEFCEVWLVEDCNNNDILELDLDDDCTINFYEYSFFAQNWLEEIE